MGKYVHMFSPEQRDKFPAWDKDRENAALCGYVRKNITRDRKKVTCKQCLKALEGE